MKNPEPRRKNLIDLTKNEKIYFTKDKKKITASNYLKNICKVHIRKRVILKIMICKTT